MPITLTDHAIQRGRERLGLTEPALQRQADRASEDGWIWTRTTGSLRRYLESGMIQHHKGNGTRIYGQHIYVIHDDALITILDLPHEYRQAVAKWRSRQPKKAPAAKEPKQAAAPLCRPGDTDLDVSMAQNRLKPALNRPSGGTAEADSESVLKIRPMSVRLGGRYIIGVDLAKEVAP